MSRIVVSVEQESLFSIDPFAVHSVSFLTESQVSVEVASPQTIVFAFSDHSVARQFYSLFTDSLITMLHHRGDEWVLRMFVVNNKVHRHKPARML